MSRLRLPKELAESDMDMTPMIDVTFLLLIFFLCLESKTLESKLSANLPKDVGPSQKEVDSPLEKLDIRIEQRTWGREIADSSGRDRFDLVGHKVQWFVGPQAVRSMKGFHQLLRREVKNLQIDDHTGQRVPKPITIKTGSGVTYGDVTWVIDMAKEAGFEVITFGGAGGKRKNSR